MTDQTTEGMMARPASAGDALIERLKTQAGRDGFLASDTEALLSEAASALSSYKERVSELEAALEFAQTEAKAEGYKWGYEEGSARLSEMEKALESIATGRKRIVGYDIGNAEQAARSALRSKGETNEKLVCERCQGNGEIVTDWERYRHPHKGDRGDEAVAECPDCSGEGYITVESADV